MKNDEKRMEMATFVAISGCTRSGKSTLARLLAERLDAEVVRQARLRSVPTNHASFHGFNCFQLISIGFKWF